MKSANKRFLTHTSTSGNLDSSDEAVRDVHILVGFSCLIPRTVAMGLCQGRLAGKSCKGGVTTQEKPSADTLQQGQHRTGAAAAEFYKSPTHARTHTHLKR